MQNDLADLISRHDFLLMEAAVVEYLRRQTTAPVHPEVGTLACIYDQTGRRALFDLYASFAEVACQGSVPLLVAAPTWKGNAHSIDQAGLPAAANREALRFMRQVCTRVSHSQGPAIILGGLLGPRFDAYRPDLGLSAEKAREVHAWQAEELAEAGAEYLMAATLPTLEEAKGLAQVMTRTRVPSLISFVTNKQGRLLDGHTLSQAVQEIDAACNQPPIGYMLNCSYPSFFHPEQESEWIFTRLIGFQANASSLEHHELDQAAEVQADDIQDWGDRLLDLHHSYGLKILGGCCGTGAKHLAYLTANRGAAASSSGA